MQNTLRLWPYFKFYPNDWLTSNTVKLMNAPQLGAYIELLCNAWTEETCTLPSDQDALKRLSRWSDEQYGDFGPVLACFPLTRNRKRRFNPRLFKERQEAIEYRAKQSEGGKKGMEARWAEKPQHSKPIRTAQSNDFEQFWEAYPKKIGKKAALQAWNKAVDKPPVIDTIKAVEIAKKCEQWTRDNGQFIPNPSTWLNQGRWTDQPLSNGHGVSLTCPTHPHLTFADAAAKATHDFLYHPKYVG